MELKFTFEMSHFMQLNHVAQLVKRWTSVRKLRKLAEAPSQPNKLLYGRTLSEATV